MLPGDAALTETGLALEAGAKGRVLVIACGALAREIVALKRANGWQHLELTCLPAKLHNRPERIPEAVRAKIRESRDRFENIFVLYADCGTGGALDQVLAEEGVERIEGPHCYAFYRGQDSFLAEHDREPGCFYLTDYLVRQFRTLVISGLGLDRHPELLSLYFGNYTRLVYLAQTDDPRLDAKAEAAAVRLGLAYERRFTGYGELAGFLDQAAKSAASGASAKDAATTDHNEPLAQPVAS